MKKLLILPLLTLFILFSIEVTSYIFIEQKPMYFRAWEYVMNTELGSYVAPFKPHSTYSGPVSGDLLKMMKFIPREDEVGKQTFVTDEYGFRNTVGLLSNENAVTAVILGTSFLGGARSSQDELVTTILTQEFDIPSYNYATYSIQNYWQDSRFIDMPPKYVIIVGNESEILQESWIEKLEMSTTRLEVPKWESYESWQNENDKQYKLFQNYEKLASNMKKYSLIKYYSNELYIVLLNKLFTRKQIARSYIASETYDPEQDMIFFDINQFDPRLDELNRERIDITIETLTKTRDILASRNSELIVVIVPSKAHIHAKRYTNLSDDNRAILVLSDKLSENKINNISMFSDLHAEVEAGNIVYYREDSHWNTLTNMHIAKRISEYIFMKETDSTGTFK